ncbi:hypothetical protein C8R45DRAFT_275666 [Mycena sanguinolenta]|nr:hypothetical protein C8R45DRAFT_275666 [Mycena sanguinolenta]
MYTVASRRISFPTGTRTPPSRRRHICHLSGNEFIVFVLPGQQMKIGVSSPTWTAYFNYIINAVNVIFSLDHPSVFSLLPSPTNILSLRKIQPLELQVYLKLLTFFNFMQGRVSRLNSSPNPKSNRPPVLSGAYCSIDMPSFRVCDNVGIDMVTGTKGQKRRLISSHQRACYLMSTFFVLYMILYRRAPPLCA